MVWWNLPESGYQEPFLVTGVLDFEFHETWAYDGSEHVQIDAWIDFSDDAKVLAYDDGTFAWTARSHASLYIADECFIPGDYNNDHTVNAADYTVWRNNLGAAMSLPNEDPTVTPGMVTAEDYDVWKAHYGEVCEVEDVGVAARSDLSSEQQVSANEDADDTLKMLGSFTLSSMTSPSTALDTTGVFSAPLISSRASDRLLDLLDRNEANSRSAQEQDDITEVVASLRSDGLGEETNVDSFFELLGLDIHS